MPQPMSTTDRDSGYSIWLDYIFVYYVSITILVIINYIIIWDKLIVIAWTSKQ